MHREALREQGEHGQGIDQLHILNFVSEPRLPLSLDSSLPSVMGSADRNSPGGPVKRGGVEVTAKSVNDGTTVYEVPGQNKNSSHNKIYLLSNTYIDLSGGLLSLVTFSLTKSKQHSVHVYITATLTTVR